MAIVSTKILPADTPGWEQVHETNDDGSITAYNRRIDPTLNDPKPFSANADNTAFWDPMIGVWRPKGGQYGYGEGTHLQQSYANMMAGYSGDMDKNGNWEGGVAPIPDWNNVKLDYYGGGKYGPVLTNTANPSGLWQGATLPKPTTYAGQTQQAGGGQYGQPFRPTMYGAGGYGGGGLLGGSFGMPNASAGGMGGTTPFRNTFGSPFGQNSFGQGFGMNPFFKSYWGK